MANTLGGATDQSGLRRIALIAIEPARSEIKDALRQLKLVGAVDDLGWHENPGAAALAGIAASGLTIVGVPLSLGLSLAVKRALLVAWGVGAAPVLVLVDDVGLAPHASISVGEALERWSRGLGVPALDWAALPSAIDRLQALIKARCAPGDDASMPFRLWVERSDTVSQKNVVEGRLVSGAARPGMVIVALPSAVAAGVVSVSATTGERVDILLDAPLPGGAGQLLVSADKRPEMADQVSAYVVWASRRPLFPGRSYAMRLGPQRATLQISTLKHRINPADLDPSAARQLAAGDVGLCNLSFSEPVLFDPSVRALDVLEIIDPVDGEIVGLGRIAFTLRRATNIHWQAQLVDKSARASLKGQRPCCLWLTGLSGSGKSTVSSLLEKRLNAAGRHTYLLDGDNVRHGLNRDLGFTDVDRVENIRRVGEVAKLFVDAGLIVLVSFISPFRAERQMARDLLPGSEFLEIFVDTPLAICESRDPKGLYKKARAGALKNFTGIDSPYEPPEHADIHLQGGTAAVEAMVDTIYREMERRGIV